MGLVDKLKAPTPVIRGTPCGVEVEKGKMTKAEGEALEAAIKPDSGWYISLLAKMLKTEGHYIAYQSLSKHRGERCRCYVTQR